jgi:hypothetical protein
MEGRVRKRRMSGYAILRQVGSTTVARTGRRQPVLFPCQTPFWLGVFLFQQLGLPSLPAQWGRPGLPATAPGPWRASEPAAPGLPFHVAVTSRHDNAHGGSLGRSASRRRRRILPLSETTPALFMPPKSSQVGRAALQPLKPLLTAARLPSSPGQWDGVVRCTRPRSSAQTFAILPWAGGRGSIHHLATKPALQIARGRPATRALAYVPSELRLHRHNQPGFFFA